MSCVQPQLRRAACSACAVPVSPLFVPTAIWDATRALMLLAVLAAAVGFAVGLSAAGGAAWRARARVAGMAMLLAGMWGGGGGGGGGGGELTAGAVSLLQ